MAIEKLPSGTRGARLPPRLLMRLMVPVMTWFHRRAHDRFGGQELLYLHTVGARSGQARTHPVARFDDGGGGWIVVASAGGAASHPAWYHNLVAHPDQVQAEVGGTNRRATVRQLDGAEREAAWAVVVARAPRFEAYRTNTDRELPVLRITPVD